ncbi:MULTISPECIES: HAD family hydrolase [Oceanimonas]|uniref:Haloacid dehalogenase n=1 Tax=Oceanimonas doudoroffii TaxID=84158 RepID=A0A233RHJ6_9GAMM|nr:MULTISPECIES: HAD-IA family hydrolase [Oceanimonas]NHI00543.1 Phosphoglycolate phosphatase [Oceanimonas sp. MB9]OXY82855.1 haloacid dehalogenase [Oceanimonas doudoroffii]
MLKAVLFDLDGTLLDTAGDMGAAANHVITGLGLNALSDEVLACTTSDGSYALLRAGIPQAMIEQHGLDRLRERMLGFYRQNLCHHTQPYAGVPELLGWLNQNAIPWGVVTNKPAALTEPLLAALPLFSQCGVTVSADTLAHKKPHPAPLLHAAAHLGVKADHCVYVGDHRRDIEAGLAAGMATLAAGWGYVSAGEDPHRWQAGAVMDSVDALSHWLKGAFDAPC